MSIPRNLSKFAANTSATGEPDVTDVTGTLPVANGGTGATSLTANNVLLGNGTSAVQVVAPGTSGNILTSNGTTWVSSAPSGGDFVFIQEVTPSSGSTYAEFKELPIYNTYFLTFTNVVGSDSGGGFNIQFGSGGATPTYVTSGYAYNTIRSSGSTTPSRLAATSSSGIQIITAVSSIWSGGSIYFYGLQNSSGTPASLTANIMGGISNVVSAFGIGMLNIVTSPITAIRIELNSRTYTGVGTFRLYGVV